MSVLAVETTVIATIPTSSDTSLIFSSGLVKYTSASRETFVSQVEQLREQTRTQTLTVSVQELNCSSYARESESSTKKECHDSAACVTRLLT